MVIRAMGYENSEYKCISEGKAWTWGSCSNCKIFKSCPAIAMNAAIVNCGICQEELAVSKAYKEKLDQLIQIARDARVEEAGYICNVCKAKISQRKVSFN